ncbi:TonB-dependent receptor [Muribaculum intestinale]|uniref:TonB-dependent receptor n=1 Tax=Muribaculum intestinale TaxID=1796646 RepID=UPI0025A96A50|nr:TonB-dependent receptor [Muribaculum intestinale]
MHLHNNHNLRRAAIAVTAMMSCASLWADITVSISAIPLKRAMKEIEKVSDLHFLYKSDLPGLNRHVTLSVKDASNKATLDKLFEGSNLRYKIEHNNAVVVYHESQPVSLEELMTDSSAQTIDITGVVSDASDEPLIGATVKVKGSSIAVATDINGRFSIKGVRKDADIEVSYIGYEPKELTVSHAGQYDIILHEGATALDEVVVVGYGQQKKVNLTGAVTVVKAKDINGRPTGNAATALQGADPSLNLKMGSGGPDASASINIRGVTSINGGSPLILVDGVEMNLARINANDIESVSILKDASAAAVYGAKASAGVILVTTKSGQEDAAPKISFDLKAGWMQSTVSTDFISSGYWSTYINDLFMNQQKGVDYTTYDEYDYAELWMRLDQKTESAERPWAIPTADNHYRYYANNDWYDHYYRKSRPMQDYNISITGGSKRINYYISGRAYIHDGNLKVQNDEFKSYSMRAKLDIKITDWLKYSFNTSFFESTYERSGSSDLNDFFYRSGNHALSSFPSTNPDGTSLWDISGIITRGTAKVGDGYNALMNYGKHKNKDQNREYLVKNQLTVTPIKDLSIVADYSYLFRSLNREMRRVNVPYSNTIGTINWITGSDDSMCWDMFTRGMTQNITQTINAYATYNPTFGENHITVTGGFNGEIYRHLYFKGERQDLMSPDLSTLNIATGEVKDFKDEIQNSVTYGYFARINYDYAGRYLLELSGRYDGSSRFSSKHRWGFFPSASLGWRFTEEKFMKDMSNWWNSGKIRLSVGTLGNQQVGYYDYIQKLTTNQLMDDITFDGTTYVNYASVSAPPASDLTWEKVTTYNAGIDLSFLNSRLNLTGDIFIRDTKDMLTSGSQLPAVYGASVPKANCADLRTRGFEIGLAWNDDFNLLGSNFHYSIGAGIGDARSKITKFDNPGRLLSKHYAGEEIGEIWGYEIDGLFQTNEEALEYMSKVDGSTYVYSDYYSFGPDSWRGVRAGDPRAVDLNGDGQITPGDNTVDNPGDRKIIGNTTPRYNYNIRGSVEWKGIDISVFFQGVGKCDWYPGNEARSFWGPYCRPYNAYIPEGFLENVWSEDNRDAYFPRPCAYAAYGSKNPMGNANTRYLQDVSYLRLKNLTIGYTLPVLRHTFRELRVYFSGENLFYWSPFKKYCKTIDPETATNSGKKSNDALTYGFSKSLTLGVNIVF